MLTNEPYCKVLPLFISISCYFIPENNRYLIINKMAGSTFLISVLLTPFLKPTG